MNFFFKIIVSVLGVSLLFLISSQSNKNSLTSYYQDCSVIFQLEDELKKRYLILLKPSHYLGSKPIGKDYIVETSNLSGETTSIKKIGSDGEPFWIASFKNKHLNRFTVYRLNQYQVYNPERFIKSFQFNIIGQIVGIDSFSEEKGKIVVTSAVYDYFSNDGKLRSISYFSDGFLQKKETYTYEKDILTKKTYFAFDPKLNRLALTYYAAMDVSFVDNTKRVAVTFYDKKDHVFKSVVEYFYENRLVFSEDSFGTRKIFNYDQSRDISNVLFLNQSNKPIKNTFYYFEKSSDEILGLVQNDQEKQLKYVKNIYYDAASVQKKEELFEYDPLGTLKQWAVFERKNSAEEVSRSSVVDDSSYQFTYDAQKRLTNRKVLDNDNFVIGQFNYTYNSKGYIESEMFLNENKEALTKTRYFYDQEGASENKKNIYDDKEKSLYPETFNFSFSALIRDLIDEKKNKMILSDFRLKLRKKLIENLLYSDKKGLRKIIFYGDNGSIHSYVRIKTEKDPFSGATSLFINVYDGDLKLPYTENPDNVYEKRAYFDTTNFVKQDRGYFKEFEEQTYDNVNPNYENLKKSVLIKIKDENLVSMRELIYDDKGKVSNELNFTEGEKFIIKSPINSDELIINEFIEGMKKISDAKNNSEKKDPSS